MLHWLSPRLFRRAAWLPGAVVAGRFLAGFGIERGAAGAGGSHGVSWIWTWFAMSSSVLGRPSRAAGVAVLFCALAGSGTPPGRWSHDGRTASRAAWSHDGSAGDRACASAAVVAAVGLACGRGGGALRRRLPGDVDWLAAHPPAGRGDRLRRGGQGRLRRTDYDTVRRDSTPVAGIPARRLLRVLIRRECRTSLSANRGC